MAAMLFFLFFCLACALWSLSGLFLIGSDAIYYQVPMHTIVLVKALGSVSQVIPSDIPIPISLAIPVRYLCILCIIGFINTSTIYIPLSISKSRKSFPTNENQEDLLLPLDTP